MLMKDDKKKSVAMIIAKLKPKSKYDDMKDHNEDMSEAPTNEHGDEMDNHIAHEAAAEEVMHAIEKKDAKAFASSLKSFVEMVYDECEQDEDEEDEHSEHDHEEEPEHEEE